MATEIRIGAKTLGDGHPVFLAAEIGINHNGDVETAKRLIDAAVLSGCDAVKFQKRTPELCVPEDQRDIMRETPWGYISYLEYRHKIELSRDAYEQIDRYCKERGLIWFASCWDGPSVAFIRQFDPPAYKVPSAAVTDLALLRDIRGCDRPVILSTGMSTMEQIRAAVETLGTHDLLITHCTSTYPCPVRELNLRMIQTLKAEFPCLVGYSGHEVGLATTVAAAALGACYVERHITLDRAMWGSDQAASVEPHGIARLAKYIRGLEAALGDGVKTVYPSELKVAKRLRRTQ